MPKNIVIEKKQVAKIALFGLLGSLPGAATFSLVAQGDSVVWAQIENTLNRLAPEAQATGTVEHTFPSGWTNNPNWSVVVTDCDCPAASSSCNNGSDNPANWCGGGGGTCFVKGTPVSMEDGSSKNIEEVEIGEKVKGKDGSINQVTEYERVVIGKRGTFKINDKIEVTGDHAFLDTSGNWKVCDLELFQQVSKLQDLNPTQLAVGDVLVGEDGEIKIEKIEHIFDRPEEETVYDLKLDGDHTYIAGGFVVHNCGDDAGDDSDDGN